MPDDETLEVDVGSEPTYKRLPVINDYCVGCGNCVEVCPAGTLRTVLDVAIVHRPDTCISCDACIPVCDDDAIHMRWVKMDEGRREVGDWTATPPQDNKASGGGLGGLLRKLFGGGKD